MIPFARNVKLIIEIQKMLGEDHSPKNLLHKATAFLLRTIPIENSKPSRLHTFLICLHYAFDYAILWSLNAALLTTQLPLLSFALPFSIARLLTSIAFMFSNMPVFFLLNKVAIAVELLVASRKSLYLQVVNIAVEIIMCGMWTLSKQQRMLHFDSRLGLRRTFLKQLCIYGAILGSNPLFYQKNSQEAIFILIANMLIIWWVDSTEFYYKANTKLFFVRLDQLMTALVLATLLNDFLGITFREYLFVSAVSLLILFIHLVNLPQNAGALFTTSLLTYSSNNEQAVAEYFLGVKSMLQTHSHQRLQTFAFKMQQQPQNYELKQNLRSAQEQGIEAKIQAIDQFIIRQLKRYSQHSKLLKDLLLYMYLPDRRVYSYLDLKNSHHNREYQRILSQKSVQFVNQSYEANRQLQQAKTRLFSCQGILNKFYRELMKEKISIQKTLALGNQYLSILQIFFSENAASFQRNPKVSLLISKYSQLCLSQYFAQKMMLNFNTNGISQQKEAQLIIGTEDDNTGLIMHLNLGLMKIASLTRLSSQKMSCSKIIPQEFRVFMQNIVKDRSKTQLSNNQQIKFQFAWIINNLGNIVCSSWRLKQTFYQSQRCLELTLRPIHIQKAILIIDQAGRILGVNQLARYFGFASNSKNLKLNEPLIEELLKNGRTHIIEGASIANTQLYAAPFNFSIDTLNSLQIPYYDKKVYVFQLLKQPKQTKLKTHAFISQNIQVDFQFNFTWSGKITNQNIDHGLPVSQVGQEKNSKFQIDYGKDIIEMRYFRQTIDYKSNYERYQQRDCPCLPTELETTLPDIQEQQFYQKWHRKRQSTPSWLKLAVFLIVISVLTSIGLLTQFLIIFNQFATFESTNLSYICKLYQNLQGAIKLGTLTIFSQLGLPQNATQLINNQIAVNSNISNQLYSINPSAFSEAGGQVLLQQLNTLNLHINHFLQNSAAASTNVNALKLLTQMIPNYYNYIDAQIITNNNQFRSNTSLGVSLIIVFALITALSISLLWFLEYRLNLQENDIVEVLKSLDNDFLLVSSNKAQKFKEIWLQENAISDYEEKQPVQEQKNNYPKHAISNLKIHIFKPIQVLWFVTMLLLLLFLRNYVQQLNSTAIQYNSLVTFTFKHVTALHQTWTLFNLNSSKTAVNSQIAFAFNQEYNKILALRDLAVNPLVSFGPFYLAFWQQQGFCGYMSDPECKNLLGLGASQGANFVVSFVSEQYDKYVNFLSNTSHIYTQPRVKKLGKIIYFYLDQFISANKAKILEDFGSVVSKLQRNAAIVFTFSIISALLFSLFSLYYSHLHRDYNRYQEILMLISFEKLKTLPAFHKYYTKRFSSV